jgi:hypothetical protein
MELFDAFQERRTRRQRVRLVLRRVKRALLGLAVPFRRGR